jgi:GTP-binding protein HflX
VASFRSTLDEALEASLLLYVVDASDPTFRSQLEVTRSVLADIGADDVPSILVLNKRDKVSPEQQEALREELPDAMMVSSKDPADVARVRQALLDHFTADLPLAELVVPYDRARAIGEIREHTTVISESFEDDGIHYRLRAAPGVLERLRDHLRVERPS